MEQHSTSGTLSRAGEYLSFKLGGEEYGIPILSVQEIRGYAEPTRIANSPHHIKGVLNLRGVIVPIVDLRMKFALPDVSYNDLTVTIVLNIGHKVIGIVVDSVSDVTALTADQIKDPPGMSSGPGTDYVTGIATVTYGDAQRMLILVDIECLLSSDELGLLNTETA